MRNQAEQSKKGDDFAARVYVMFAFEPDKASFWERAQRRLAEAIHGRELPGNTISYVSTSNTPQGQFWDNPFISSTKMMSMGPSSQGEWRSLSVDVFADYKQTLPRDPAAPGCNRDHDR